VTGDPTEISDHSREAAVKRSVFNQKGGVGKTSITCNLAAAFAKAGKKTLVIDLDAQANATQYLLGTAANQAGRTVADFFEASLSFKLFKDSLKETVYETAWPNLWIVPADRSLLELQPKLEGRYKIFKLRDAVDAAVQDLGFDEVLFDTPPALNFYSMSALMASDRVLIPFDCDAFSAHALLQVMEVIEEVASDHQPELRAEGVVINHFQAGAKLPAEAIEALMAQGFPVLSPYLSSSVVMRESHGASTPLAFFRPKHKLTAEFAAIAAALLGPASAKSGSKAKTKATAKAGATTPRAGRAPEIKL
jgi:chromosome partitioning protein